MPVFNYKATTPEGKVHTGSREGRDQAAVIAWLQESGYIPIYAQESNALSATPHRLRSLFSREKINDQQVLAFTEQLATLVKASVPLDQSLRILLTTTDEEGMRSLLGSLIAEVEAGKEFSAALQAQNRFSSFYINMIKASEASGNLDSGLEQLYLYLDNVRQVREKITSAMLYPLILVAVSGISVIVILTFVVPKISQLFVGTQQALPAATQFVISTSDFLVTHWWMLLILVVILFAYVRYLQGSDKGRRAWQRFAIRIPLLRDFMIKSETAKFTHSLSTLSVNGVPLQTALPIANATISNVALSSAVTQALETFKEGKSLHEVLQKIEFFPTLALQLIKVGEETGELPQMLKRIATIYDKQTSAILQRMLTLLEPALIVTLGIAIGGIIVSILLGIISINDLPF